MLGLHKGEKKTLKYSCAAGGVKNEWPTPNSTVFCYSD